MEKIKSLKTIKNKQKIRLVIKPLESQILSNHSANALEGFSKDSKRQKSDQRDLETKKSISPLMRPTVPMKQSELTKEALQIARKKIFGKITILNRSNNSLREKNSYTPALVNEKVYNRLKNNLKLDIKRLQALNNKETPAWTARESANLIEEKGKHSRELSFELRGWDYT